MPSEQAAKRIPRGFNSARVGGRSRFFARGERKDCDVLCDQSRRARLHRSLDL